MIHTIINAAGAQTVLNERYYVMDHRGLSIPPGQLATSRYPGQQGETTRARSQGARHVELTLQTRTWDLAGIEAEREYLMDTFAPELGPALYRVEKMDGTVRELRRVILDEDGLPLDANMASIHQRGRLEFDLYLRADDPYWYDPVDSHESFALAEPGGFVLPAVFPIYLRPSGIAASRTLVNGGHAQTWPTWTIIGPGLEPRLTNRTLGRSLQVLRRLTAGEQLTIETEPSRRGVWLRAGDTTLDVSGDRRGRFWSLTRGLNDVEVSMLDAVGGQVSISWPTLRAGI